MTTTTAAVAVAAGVAFTQVADGAVYKTVGVQAGTERPLLIAVAASLPSNSSDDWIQLYQDADNSDSVWINLAATDKIYAKSMDGVANKVRLIRETIA